MRNLGLDPEDQVYTGLFNACANSPWPKQSLKQAENLFSALQDKGIQLNLITVKAAAKAMAFCGNFPRAFTIMDEASTYLTLDAECFNHLLMACAADKQKGFCRALQVRCSCLNKRLMLSHHSEILNVYMNMGLKNINYESVKMSVRNIYKFVMLNFQFALTEWSDLVACTLKKVMLDVILCSFSKHYFIKACDLNSLF